MTKKNNELIFLICVNKILKFYSQTLFLNSASSYTKFLINITLVNVTLYCLLLLFNF